jgi:hypothetical protein
VAQAHLRKSKPLRHWWIPTLDLEYDPRKSDRSEAWRRVQEKPLSGTNVDSDTQSAHFLSHQLYSRLNWQLTAHSETIPRIFDISSSVLSFLSACGDQFCLRRWRTGIRTGRRGRHRDQTDTFSDSFLQFTFRIVIFFFLCLFLYFSPAVASIKTITIGNFGISIRIRGDEKPQSAFVIKNFESCRLNKFRPP